MHCHAAEDCSRTCFRSRYQHVASKAKPAAQTPATQQSFSHIARQKGTRICKKSQQALFSLAGARGHLHPAFWPALNEASASSQARNHEQTLPRRRCLVALCPLARIRRASRDPGQGIQVAPTSSKNSLSHKPALQVHLCLIRLAIKESACGVHDPHEPGNVHARVVD